MRIRIIGAGGVGGYLGGRLAEAGEDVAFLARGEHREAILRDGLRILSPRGDARIFPARASADPGALFPGDLVIVAVKNWDTEGAAGAAAQIAGPGAEIVSFQNGVEAWDRIARTTGKPVLGGVAYITASIESPGVIRHAGTVERFEFGAFDGQPSRAASHLLEACRRAGVGAAIPDDIGRAIWEKFLFLTAFSALTALTRRPIGPIRENAETRGLLEGAMREAAAVGAAKGVSLRDDSVARQMALVDRLAPDAASSMLHDIVRGNRLESPWLCGAVARMGREFSVETPVQSFAAALLGLSAAGAAPSPRS
jgi:2-dehydropantoate 2-reductase